FHRPAERHGHSVSFCACPNATKQTQPSSAARAPQSPQRRLRDLDLTQATGSAAILGLVAPQWYVSSQTLESYRDRGFGPVDRWLGYQPSHPADIIPRGFGLPKIEHTRAVVLSPGKAAYASKHISRTDVPRCGQ